MVNSSHPVCNHAQKWEIVQAGLGKMRGGEGETWGQGDKEMGRQGDGETRRWGDGEIRGQGEIQNPSWKVLGREVDGEMFFPSNFGEEHLHPKLSAKSPIQNPSWKVLGEENLHPKLSAKSKIQNRIDPLKLVAAVGDPMQVAVAGMAISASRNGGVLLAG
ncbi:MAG: hypothetical protein AAFQ23_15675, partial [Cyanobacteria bacterium J06623_1]